MTRRKVTTELAAALDAERHRRGLSLNRTAIALIEESLGVSGHSRSNGLHQITTTWSEEEYRQFEKAVAPLTKIDDDLWR